MSTYILRPYFTQKQAPGHLRPDREFEGKRDIEYQIKLGLSYPNRDGWTV